MFHVSLIAAFLGGLLMLLPSCGPLVLPAFFAYGFREKRKLVRATAIFFAGFLAVFLPLGLGLAAAAGFLVKNRALLQEIAGLFLMLFGVAALFGISLKNVITFRAAPSPGSAQDGAFSLFLFGASFGLAAGGCTAPILGAVLTTSAVQGAGLSSLVLLAAFSFGMIFPLFLLAASFEKFRLERLRAWLFTAGLKFRLAGRARFFPFSNILSGLLFFGLGLLFFTAQASSPFAALGQKLGLTDVFFSWSEAILQSTQGFSFAGEIIVLAVFFGVAALFLRARRSN